MNKPALVWFRQDLRLADNLALTAAKKHGCAVVPVFIWAPEEEGNWPPGGASKWWLHRSLAALDDRLRAAGSRLVLRRGPTLETLRSLLRETAADAVFWNRRYEPAAIARDRKVEASLCADNLEVHTFNTALLYEPWSIQNQSRKPFRVFTPFWRKCLEQLDPPNPLDEPRRLKAPAKWPHSIPLEAFELEPKFDWAGGLRSAWRPGEEGGAANLRRFLSRKVHDYPEQRNRPDVAGTSRLSPHLHFGEISPRQIWRDFRRLAAKEDWTEIRWRSSQFLTELGWREFAHHLLYHFPRTPEEPLRPEFQAFPWRKDEGWFEAWQKGRTGYPMVDAGMRELWATGWMHNRVRMIVASFLVKDLLLPWQAGACWFWDTLVDADLAQNTLGWQWSAGCGADAAPYFRVFNPTLQGQKFDPDGDYVRHWCPELSRLPDKWVHCPGAAPAEVRARAGVKLGFDYPEPLVSHAIAREVALEAFAKMKALTGKSRPSAA